MATPLTFSSPLKLASIPAIKQKVDLASSIEREREHPKLRVNHTHSHLEGSLMGLACEWAVAIVGGWMKAHDSGGLFRCPKFEAKRRQLQTQK